MFKANHKVSFCSFVVFVFSIISITLFLSQGELFAVSSEIDLVKKEAKTSKKTVKKIPFLQEVGPFEGFIAPDFTFNDIQGKSVSLSQFKGKVVFLNVWATWCGPCRVEMPDMEKLWQKFKKEDFVILAVSIDRQGKSAVKPFLQELGLTFPVLLDPDGTIQNIYKINALPSSLLIDKAGYVDTRVTGARDWFSPDIIKIFEELIHEEDLIDDSGAPIKRQTAATKVINR